MRLHLQSIEIAKLRNRVPDRLRIEDVVVRSEFVKIVSKGVAANATSASTKEYDRVELSETILRAPKMTYQSIADWDVTRML
jgi:hypothetical protein